MDPMAQAFAYYDFDETQGRLVYTPGMVNAKYFINSDNFKPGLHHPERRVGEPLARGHNSLARLRCAACPGRGAGAKSLGEEIANSDAFAVVPGREGVQGGVLPRRPAIQPIGMPSRDAVTHFQSGLQPAAGVRGDRRVLRDSLTGSRHVAGRINANSFALNTARALRMAAAALPSPRCWPPAPAAARRLRESGDPRRAAGRGYTGVPAQNSDVQSFQT